MGTERGRTNMKNRSDHAVVAQREQSMVGQI